MKRTKDEEINRILAKAEEYRKNMIKNLIRKSIFQVYIFFAIKEKEWKEKSW